MDLGTIVFGIFGLFILATFAGGVQQVIEGELIAGLGMLVLGAVLSAGYFVATAIFGHDAIPVDVAALPGIRDIPGVSEFLDPTPTPTPARAI